ncbi:twin-arginine translocation signal domain-containing protein [Streptomyces capitiformicae]
MSHPVDRRRFLRAAGAGAAALGPSPSSPPTPPSRCPPW